MSDFDALAEHVRDELLDPKANASVYDLHDMLEANVEVDVRYVGGAGDSHFEHVRIEAVQEAEGTHFALRVQVTSDIVGTGTVPLSKETLVTICRDLGVVHPTHLVGSVLPIVFSEGASSYPLSDEDIGFPCVKDGVLQDGPTAYDMEKTNPYA